MSHFGIGGEFSADFKSRFTRYSLWVKPFFKKNIWEVIQIINISFDILLNRMMWCLNAIMTPPSVFIQKLGNLVQYCHLLLLICHNIYLLNPSQFFIPRIVLTTPRNSRISVRSQNADDQQEGGLLSPTAAAAVGDSSRSIKLSFNSNHSPRRLLIPQLPSEKWKQRRYEHPGCYS